MARRRFVFRGTIQGVGFRPAVFRAAAALGLGGFVQNRRSDVVAEVEGEAAAVERFPEALARMLPPAARIVEVDSSDIAPSDGSGGLDFRIVESARSPYLLPPIPPDLAICADCARELLDPRNRRYLYPFITCTQCGPRYSILERTPFDRANTSMHPFPQCPECLREYRDPGDRRFHSQTNSCPKCGPRLSCADSRGRPVDGDPLAAAVRALGEGQVVALQGIGGFHLAADPARGDALLRLRGAKERERKPFALMVRDLEEARALCALAPAEEALLRASESPIVIAPRAGGSPAHLRGVSDTGTLGVMLPYTPLHLLLFGHPGAPAAFRHLVMTSGNPAGEPIVTDIGEAMRRLADAADLFVFHDRRIVFRADDSVVRTGPSSPPFFLRRSRGYVPRQLSLASRVRGVVLGLGGDLKSAPALARGRDVHLFPFLGDLEDPETLAQFDASIRQVLELYEVSPERVVHDLHPEYHSTRWALESGTGRVVGIQHHFAHALSVMAEHGLEETLALAFDGTGYGTDGTTWGGEFLHVTRAGFNRLGSFAPFPLPGGDAATLHPPRIAFAILSGRTADGALPAIPGIDRRQAEMLLAMIAKGVNCPDATSLGRIFDAAAAILGLAETTSYEGEGPIRLEGAALEAFRGGAAKGDLEPDEIIELLPGQGDGRLFLADARPLLRRLLAQRSTRTAGELALLFHRAVARASLEGARLMREATGMSRVALSGGVFQNLLLRELLVPHLKKDGFEVFLNEEAPPGDGGISVGQVWFDQDS